MDERVKAVRNMQEYIERHLYENINMAELSSVSNYSPWYSYRMFNQFLGISPADYIRRLRLSDSAMRLRDEKMKIVDVAFLVGFNSVDGYQRAFLKEFGCNPREFVQNPVPIYLFTPYKLTESKKEIIMKEVNNVYIQVIEKQERKVLIKRGRTAKEYWTYCNEVGCDVWGLLKSIKSISGEPVCLWLPEKYIKPDTSEYVQGVEVAVDYNGVIPDGFDVITLPKCKYVRFQGEPFEEEDFCEAIETIQASIKKFHAETLGLTIDNDNPRIQLEPIGERGYIELVPVK